MQEIQLLHMSASDKDERIELFYKADGKISSMYDIVITPTGIQP